MSGVRIPAPPLNKKVLYKKIRGADTTPEQEVTMCTYPKILYLPSKMYEGTTEFFRLSRVGEVIVAERLDTTAHQRTELSHAVSPHGSFDSLNTLLEPYNGSWEEIGRGSKHAIGEAIERFAVPTEENHKATT